MLHITEQRLLQRRLADSRICQGQLGSRFTDAHSIPSMSLKLLPILGVPSLPSFRLSACARGLPRFAIAARWLKLGLTGLFAAAWGPEGASLAEAELVIEDAVSVVTWECGLFCLAAELPSCRSASRASCSGRACLDVPGGRRAAEANGSTVVPCELASSPSCVPSPSANGASSRGRFCWKRGGLLNS